MIQKKPRHLCLGFALALTAVWSAAHTILTQTPSTFGATSVVWLDLRFSFPKEESA